MSILAGQVFAAPRPAQATTGQPQGSLSGPSVWFAPLPPMPERPGREYIGSEDFMALFDAKAPWASVSNRIDVFKLYGDWIEYYATDAQISQVVKDLNSRGIAIAVEAGPLTATSECGRGVESFNPVNGTLNILARLAKAGGNVTLIAMDEPFYFAHYYKGLNACNWSVEKVAGKVASYMKSIKALYPWITIGDIEPLMSGIPLTQYENWIDAFRSVSGSNFPFVHIDVDWSRSDWPTAAKELQTYTQSKGIQFGMIYDGLGYGSSDSAWLGAAEQRMATYEAKYEGTLNHVIFQSWEDHPDYVLPESQSTSFTHLVASYFRIRASLTVLANPGTGSTLHLNGKLNDVANRGIDSARVAFYMGALNGSGFYANYTVSGVVPVGANSADVGFRVNTECRCSGNGFFSLYHVVYNEGGGSSNPVPNPDFSQGLQGWGQWGNGTILTKPSDLGNGNMLRAMVDSSRRAAMNSGVFSVASGANYHLTFGARVSPLSLGGGYFAIIFLSESGEIRRDTIAITPAQVHVGDAITGLSGTFTLDLHGLPTNTQLLMEGIYSGEDNHWPAFGSSTLTMPDMSSSTSLTCTRSSVVVGSAIICKATVRGSSPTGRITWSGNTPGRFSAGSCRLFRGACFVKYTPVSANSSSTLSAGYLGDPRNLPSAGTYGLEVGVKASRTNVSCRPASSTGGWSNTITCVARVGGYAPTGTVDWSQVGGTGIVSFVSNSCSLRKGVCTVTLTGMASGTAVIQASYGGDPNNSGSGGSSSLTLR